jgi:hypothetical protein
VKGHTNLRLLVVALLAVLCLVRIPLVEATIQGSSDKYRVEDKYRVKDKDGKKKTSVPEGSAAAALVLAASALGCGLLVSRRKRRATGA